MKPHKTLKIQNFYFMLMITKMLMAMKKRSVMMTTQINIFIQVILFTNCDMQIENQNSKENRIKVGVKSLMTYTILSFSKQKACVIEARKEVLKTKKM